MHQPGYAKDEAFELDGTGRFEVSQRTVTGPDFYAFENELRAGSIKPALLNIPGAAEAKIAATRLILQEGLGQTAVPVATHYSLPTVSSLVGEAGDGAKPLLLLLERQLNLPFTSSYASRLGNYEVFRLHPWLDGAQPFLIERASRPVDSQGPETLEICRTPVFAQARHIAHVTGRAHGDVVIDQLVTLGPRQLRVPVESPEVLGQLDFRIFSEDGKTLLHSERNTYITQIGLVMAPITRQLEIDDNLSRRARTAGGSGTSIVHVHNTIRSQVGAPPPGSWRRFAQEMDDLVAAQLPKPSEDRWFERGIEGEFGAIAEFRHLLDGGRTSRAVLVDPWFGPDALRALVLRLGSRDVPLNIVTSWARSQPDTGEPLDADNRPMRDLEEALRQVELFLGPPLTVMNVVDGKDQAFHDRYLLLYSHEGPSKVYLLSNSLNRAGGHWPFCMSLLAGDVALHVKCYIEGLCQGRDIARAKALTTNFKWPSDAA